MVFDAIFTFFAAKVKKEERLSVSPAFINVEGNR
jgi:hypothetical protein